VDSVSVKIMHNHQNKQQQQNMKTREQKLKETRRNDLLHYVSQSSQKLQKLVTMVHQQILILQHKHYSMELLLSVTKRDEKVDRHKTASIYYLL